MSTPIDLSTAGIKFGYAVETTAGTKPAAFIRLQGASSLPELNPEPETYETTTLDATTFKTYVDGLRDTGGALQIKFNQSQVHLDEWKALVSAYQTTKAASKATWFVFYIPGLTDSFFFRGNPSSSQFGGAEVGNKLETTEYVTPTGDIGWATKVEPADAV